MIEDLIGKGWQARREGRYEDAERDLLGAIARSRQDGVRTALIRALKSLAHVVRDQGQDERGRHLYEEAVALAREEADPLLLAHTVRHLGDLHLAAGRLTEAEPCYVEALELYGATSEAAPGDHANAVRPAALLKEAMGETGAALELWSEARRLYAQAGVVEGVAECEERLSALR